MGKWINEVLVGIVLALGALAIFAGYDLSFFILPISIVALVGLLASKNTLGAGQFSERLSLAGPAIPDITFASIGGQEMAKRELLEALTFLKESEKTKLLGIRPLKGVLLVGPPGTGKTLMAKAAANYTESVFVAASGAQFVQMYAGVGASRVRQLFKQARSLAEQQQKNSAIVFIDEIDVLGAKRGKNHSHMEYDQTLNELLTQMDGVKSESSVQILVVGATNRSDLLDSALLRPGRFDRIVQVDLPDKHGRLQILKIHARNKPLSPEVCLEAIANETYGFSGAHLESLLNEAAILALRGQREAISSRDLREAIDKVMLGEKSGRSLAKDELERVAIHEVGHALISEWVRPGSVASITITPRNQALGYIRQNPQGDQYLYTKDELLRSIQVSVAGTISEDLLLGQRSTGAVGDIDQATDLAKRMIYAGLSPLGIVSSDLPNTLLHETIGQIIKEQEEVVENILRKQLDVVKRISQKLLDNESMNGEEFRRLSSQSFDLALG